MLSRGRCDLICALKISPVVKSLHGKGRPGRKAIGVIQERDGGSDQGSASEKWLDSRETERQSQFS